MGEKDVSFLREVGGQIKLEWDIQNFLHLPHQNFEKLTSPDFLLDNASWNLSIYPNGESRTNCGKISLYLKRNSFTVERTVSFSFGLNANGSLIANCECETTYTEEEDSWGYQQFVARSAITNLVKDASWDGAVTVLFSARLVNSQFQDATTQASLQEGVYNLSKNLEELLIDGRRTDVKMKVQGEVFNAHKSVLGARSPVFNAMFDHEMAEKNSGIVEISDLNPASFQDFLIFIYSGKFDILTPSNALDIYKAADKYDLKDIKTECSLRMASWLSVDNILDVVLLATTHGETELLNHATEYFFKNAKEILSTDYWKTFLYENILIANDLLLKMVSRQVVK